MTALGTPNHDMAARTKGNRADWAELTAIAWAVYDYALGLGDNASDPVVSLPIMRGKVDQLSLMLDQELARLRHSYR